MVSSSPVSDDRLKTDRRETDVPHALAGSPGTDLSQRTDLSHRMRSSTPIRTTAHTSTTPSDQRTLLDSRSGSRSSHVSDETERRLRTQGLRRSLVPLVVGWTLCSPLWIWLITQRSIPVDDLLLDPAAIGGIAWYSGLVSSLGVFFWTVAVCACTGAAFVAHQGHRRGAHATFRGAAFVFGVLLADDLFLLHSNVFPSIMPVSKLGVLAAEAVLSGLWVVSSWSELRRTRWLILAFAGWCFALSLGADTFLWGHGPDRMILILEDGPKFFGTLALATWSVTTAADIIRSVLTSSQAGAGQINRTDSSL